jgi:hypothetical protein
VVNPASAELATWRSATWLKQSTQVAARREIIEIHSNAYGSRYLELEGF